jgi:hypothetical protein
MNCCFCKISATVFFAALFLSANTIIAESAGDYIVFDFANMSGSKSQSIGSVVAALFASTLEKKANVSIVPRDILVKTALESTEGISVAAAGANPDLAIKLGKLLSARGVIMGSVNEFTISETEGTDAGLSDIRVGIEIRVIDVETGTVGIGANGYSNISASFPQTATYAKDDISVSDTRQSAVAKSITSACENAIEQWAKTAARANSVKYSSFQLPEVAEIENEVPVNSGVLVSEQEQTQPEKQEKDQTGVYGGFRRVMSFGPFCYSFWLGNKPYLGGNWEIGFRQGRHYWSIFSKGIFNSYDDVEREWRSYDTLFTMTKDAYLGGGGIRYAFETNWPCPYFMLSPGFCLGFWYGEVREELEWQSSYSRGYYDYDDDYSNPYNLKDRLLLEFGGPTVELKTGYKYFFLYARYTMFIGSGLVNTVDTGIQICF